MNTAEAPQTSPREYNAFGFLRLLFASLVIVSHVPEIVDGNRDRELLTQLFGTMSFGEFAVNGFFVISGFLITGSLVNSRSTTSYLLKRIGRIYPGFIVASLFCVLIVAPLSGAYLTRSIPHTGIMAGLRMIILSRPMVAGAFPGHHYADTATALNGPLWTIQYEFTCYLLVIAIVAAGWLRRPAVLVAFTCLLLATPPALIDQALPGLSHPMLFPAPPSGMLRLVGMFVAGTTFYVLQHRLRFKPWSIMAAAAGLAASLSSSLCANLGFAVFGGYLIFAIAKLAGPTALGKVNNKTDISYGVYLYAAPVQHLLMRYVGDDLILLGVTTWVIAVILGWLSWTWVEKPALQVVRRLDVASRFSLAGSDRREPPPSAMA